MAYDMIHTEIQQDIPFAIEIAGATAAAHAYAIAIAIPIAIVIGNALAQCRCVPKFVSRQENAKTS